jgi:hypothetical protein
VPPLTEAPLNLNVATSESLSCTVVVMDARLNLGLPLLFLEQPTTKSSNGQV